MNCHQILSGACNSGDRCCAVGSVEGIPFTAYAAGYNIVILASTFERVQIIPGAVHNYVRISALDCSTDTGKIAAAYNDKIRIFEPTPLIHSETSATHNLEYKWVQTGLLQATSHITSLSWNLEGTRLLTGGTSIKMWRQKIALEDNSDSVVTFEIGGYDKEPANDKQEDSQWECIWSCQTANPVHHMAFSPDGTLFATSGKYDRLVKVWYENKHVLFPTNKFDQYKSENMEDAELVYNFVYLAHPRAITHISWRKTSKYMPKGSVSNILVTSCQDNICRLWIETVLPDDGLINMSQFDPLVSQNPKFRTHRHKHRFMQRLKHMKTCFNIRRHAKNGTISGNVNTVFGGLINDSFVGQSTIPSLPSTFSVHDFHSYGYHGTGVSPGMHFHLAASLNAETDIPLVPSMQTSDIANKPNFILHWLNNKDMYFSLQAESILHELAKKIIDKEDSYDAHDYEKSSEAFSDKNAKLENNDKQYLSQESVNQNDVSSNSIYNTNSLNPEDVLGNIADSLDMKIDCLLRDWHHSPDLLFSIHPIDGSYLIWVVEWLDDYYPGSFRQAQVSFSTRIPSAFPLGDAMSMSTTVSMYNTGTGPLYFREMVRGAKKQQNNANLETADFKKNLPKVEEEQEQEQGSLDDQEESQNNNADGVFDETNKIPSQKEKQEGENDGTALNPSPTISMVTKHSNGTLNLWQLTFADKTKFTQVLSIGHVCRASGHRFRVNDITCHPVLPLLLTTSHHNIPDTKFSEKKGEHHEESLLGFCSELILWRVDAVGPLSHSGGVTELARINSPEISAFCNVAWIPTLLPSTTLGSYSNSPSACFVASDGESLRIYQAVIDARTLLAELSSSQRKNRKTLSNESIFSDCSSADSVHKEPLYNKINIVSQQSTARPGCIIQLDAITDALHDWQNTQFLHVFQEQLITGERNENKAVNNPTDQKLNGWMETQLGAMVDLQQNAEFEEPFYIVVIERTSKGSTIHMWRIVIASKSPISCLPDFSLYVPDSNIVQDLDEQDQTSRSFSNEKDIPNNLNVDLEKPHIKIITRKVCTQEFPIPDGVDVIHASPAAGHLSSSSIYPACFAPYIIVTACSDSISRFWRCNIQQYPDDPQGLHCDYEWNEWKMFSKNEESAIEICGQPLNISAAYSGRVACAYKYGKSFTRSQGDLDSRYVNLCVAIYECESTGGSEWVLEDTIHLKNVVLPQIQLDPNLDLSYLNDNRILQKKQRLNQVLQTFTHDDNRTQRSGDHTPELGVKASGGLLAVPSFSTLQSLRKSIIEHGNTCPLTQKHLVQLDWVSKEDGSHILTVAVGNKILLYTSVSSDLAQANIKAMKESQTTNRPLLRKASSLAQPHFNDEIRWMKLRQIELKTADGLPPLPMQISWVRDGILVVGMDSEMHVYSQWKPKTNPTREVEIVPDTRNLRDEDLRSLANETAQRRLNNVASMPHLSRVSSMNLQMLSTEKKKKIGAQSTSHIQSIPDQPQIPDYMTDYGLFQASRIACPVLPQYHPKQLMELLNSGKIRWVKAILAHLVRCMSGAVLQDGGSNEENLNRQRAWSRSRTLSVNYVGGSTPDEQLVSTAQIPEELTLDYAEITSVPPLPLWILLIADKEETYQSSAQKKEMKGYDELFDEQENYDSLDDLLDGGESRAFNRRVSIPEKSSVSHFGLRQGQVLSRLLTHTHLPGLSSLDQMHLLALADTVASCNADFSEKFALDAAKKAIIKESVPNDFESKKILTDSIDDCGLRFLLAMKHYNYLLRCLPLLQRTQFQRQGVGTSNIVWAFHSESEEELLNLIPSYSKGQVKWGTLRELGVGWWLKSNNLLRTCAEKLAKCAYLSQQDPLDAAIFYLAMKKKSLVCGLFRSKRDEKMTKFFQNNFNEDRWRKAALKNAFVLLGKQRFEHAAAFFLLANSLNDALEVCINKLQDLQLALMIARLYEGEHDLTPPTYVKLLYDEILGLEEDGTNEDLSRVHPDPFLRSIAFWILKKYSSSLNTLLLNNVGHNHPAYQEEDNFIKTDSSHNATNPNVFNFYIYLRTHPMLIKQQIALTAQEKNRVQVVLSGFSYSADMSGAFTSDKQLQVENTITALERQLYFTTAHRHFKAGCPALALEVLSKLPSKVIESKTKNKLLDDVESGQDALITTGTFDWSYDSTAKKVDSIEKSDQFDWGAPVPKSEDKFEIKWDDNDEEDDESSNEAINMKPIGDSEQTKKAQVIVDDNDASQEKFDIMAQQLKFVACLKILMEELSTLATGFEVDGGQLRYQLYIWLEKEVEALKQLCSYSSSEFSTQDEADRPDLNQGEKDVVGAGKLPEKPTLYEILIQEKQDFEAKVQRAARRKHWLKANETLLRTLLSYCSLHGASGGGLASVRMELVLLLQELQQEKTQQQLLSPLPFPTTLPLLSACVAGNKTVIADPIKYLQSHTQDMLQTVIDFRNPPNGLKQQTINEIYVLRDLAVALSSCIYQSLCDSESFIVKQGNQFGGAAILSETENIAKINAACQCSHLMINANTNQRRRKYSSDEPLSVSTPPSKWPGVTNLRALLAREGDEDVPKLNVLLLESFVATFVSLLVYALSTCDCKILYRLSGQQFSSASWAVLFGGGTKKLLRKATTEKFAPHLMQPKSQESLDTPVSEGSMWTAVTSLTKQRVKLNMKLLEHFTSSSGAPNMKEDKPTYREQFISPDMSLVSYFLTKPIYKGDSDEEAYDSDDSGVSDTYGDEEEDFYADSLNNDTKNGEPPTRKQNTEHTNPNSYAWRVMRLAIIKLSQKQLKEFINIAGIELQELPVTSPLVHGIIRTLSLWQKYISEELLNNVPPQTEFIPGCYIDPEAKGSSIHKYRSLLEKQNSPFSGHSSAASARRLWNYLVRQESVRDIFIRAVFGNKNQQQLKSSPSGSAIVPEETTVSEPIRIIHKEQESISSFCINNNTFGLMALATPKEIQEMDISLLLDCPNWFEDECEYDIMNWSRETDTLPSTSFLVINTYSDNNMLSQANGNVQNFTSSPNPQHGATSQSGRGASVVLKHKIDNVKRMCAHPLMPLYLTGGQDGSVHLWEWGHQQVVCTPRPPGTFAKVTRCRFSQHGNKFGIADNDGNLSLWQAGLASQSSRSFFNHQCHNKGTSDFVFLGSCSLIATAGYSSENKNVAIWDTLLPLKKSLVTSFACHDQGASSMLYAPQHQVLISAGKKGDICVFDVRQRAQRQRFQAHESSVKCVAIDPREELFATGSADGDIKIWNLASNSLLYSFPGEHAKNSFFKHTGQGVTQIQIDSEGRLFSCGSDGSMKVRQLPDKEFIVQPMY